MSKLVPWWLRTEAVGSVEVCQALLPLSATTQRPLDYTAVIWGSLEAGALGAPMQMKMEVALRLHSQSLRRPKRGAWAGILQC